MSNGVLEATAGTTFKLFLVCGFIGWLLGTGRLSEDTAPVLSKVLPSSKTSVLSLEHSKQCLLTKQFYAIAGGLQCDAAVHALHQSSKHIG